MDQFSDVAMQDFLNDVTDAILFQTASPTDVQKNYAVDPQTAEEFSNLIQDLQLALLPVEPSSQFIETLKNDLTGVPEQGLSWRIQSLPTRVRIAAFATVILGFVLFLRTRLIGNDTLDENDEKQVIQSSYNDIGTS